MASHWPLFGLRLYTPRLELRVPTPSDLDDLADLAAEGVHDPDDMPFSEPWTDAAAEELPLRVLQYNWRLWGQCRPEDWTVNLAVLDGGTVVGNQGVGAVRFAVLREVESGSWLGRRFQGRGIGTEMRAAVLHLAFAGLGAQWATSGVFEDNAAPYTVSRRLGYVDDGVTRLVRRGRPTALRRLRLSRQRWEAHRGVEVRVEGLDPCLGLLDARPES